MKSVENEIRAAANRHDQSDEDKQAPARPKPVLADEYFIESRRFFGLSGCGSGGSQRSVATRNLFLNLVIQRPPRDAKVYTQGRTRRFTQTSGRVGPAQAPPLAENTRRAPCMVTTRASPQSIYGVISNTTPKPLPPPMAVVPKRSPVLFSINP